MKTENELIEISKHLYYEFSMFIGLTNEMIKGYPPGLMNNALLESFTVHVRNLIDFLYPKENSGNDDVIAEHFFENPNDWLEIRPEITPLLIEAKKRTNKELAHLTYTRLKISPEQKVWAFRDIAIDMVNCFDVFITNVSRNLLPSDWDNFWTFRDKFNKRPISNQSS